MSDRLVLLWGRTAGVGGTERRMAELGGLFQASRVNCVSVHLSRGANDLTRLMEDSGYEVIVASRLGVFRVLLRHRPTVILAFGLGASLVARVYRSLMWRTRLIDARNGLEQGRSSVRWGIDRLSQGLVSAYMTNSGAAKDHLVRHGVDRARVAVNPSGIDTAWTIRENVVREDNRVVMVGNARPEKNQIAGLRAVLALDRPIRLVVYTDNGEELWRAWGGATPDSSKSLDVIEGHLVAPRDLARAAVLLHPSRSESLPRAVLEARAQGTRVVATDAGETAALLGRSDFLVPIGDLGALTMALDAALAGTEPGEEFSVRTTHDYFHDLLKLCRGAS